MRCNNGKALLSFSIILSVLAAVWFATIRSPSISEARLREHAFPQRPVTTLILPPPDENAADPVRIGTVKYWKDGFTRKEIVLEYKSGMQEFQYFNEWGTMLRSSQFFRADAHGQSRRRSEATFAGDGSTYVSHQIWRQDGTLERSGSTLRGGEYEHKYFAADGNTLVRRRVFATGDKALKFEEIFDRQGAKLAVIDNRVTIFGTETEVTLFKGAQRTAHFVKDILEEHGEIFADDGTTVVARYVKDITMFEEVYMDPLGLVIQTRRSTRFNSSEVVTFAAASEPGVTYRQVWRLSPTVSKSGPAKAMPAARLLRTVDEIRDGKTLYTARIGKEGLHVESFTYDLPGGGSIVKEVDAQGQVLKVTELNAWEQVLSSNPPEQPQTVVLPAEALQDPPHPELPEFKDEAAPPRLYDYP